MTFIIVQTSISFLGGFFVNFNYFIQHYFLCRPSDSTESDAVEIEPRTVAPFDIGIDSQTLDSHTLTRLDLIH
jgi:hypothetical protein